MPGKHDARGQPKKDEQGRSVSPVNGQPVPKGTPFRTSDERAKEAGRRSGAARREKGDLRKLCKIFLEEECGTDENGQPITGGQLMINTAIKGLKRGNPKFWELVRDTAGFKPVDKVILTEVDPDVIDEVEQLVKEAGDGG